MELSRLDYRGGLSPIRTSSELKRDLAVPIYLLLVGKSEVKYPFTDRSNPSPSVGITYIGSPNYSVWIHWTQWESVCVPILEDSRLRNWRHELGSGDLNELSRDSVGFLYSCDFAELERERPGSKNSEFIRQLGNIIEGRAVQSGY